MAKANKWRFQLKPSHVITLISFQQKVNDYQWKKLKTILFFSEDEKKKVWSVLLQSADLLLLKDGKTFWWGKKSEVIKLKNLLHFC